jgi:hypothetical protein
MFACCENGAPMFPEVTGDEIRKVLQGAKNKE